VTRSWPIHGLHSRHDTASVGPGKSIDVQLTGVAGIPTSGVAAVVFNLTAVSPTTGGFLTVYPTGSARPTASTINFVGRQTVVNEVIATLGTGGKVTIYNAAGNTHVLADVSGWFATDSYYTGLTPARVLDTRIGLGAAKAPVGAAQHVDIPVAGHNGIPTTGAIAVAVNITATQPTTTTYVTAYPTGDTRPTASNLNLNRGQTTAVLAVTKLRTDCKITLYNAAGNTHLIADITGYFTTTGQYTPLAPARVLDTRGSGGALGAHQMRRVDFGGAGVPDTADAVIVSLTAVTPEAAGFLTVSASGISIPRPRTSTSPPGVPSPISWWHESTRQDFRTQRSGSTTAAAAKLTSWLTWWAGSSIQSRLSPPEAPRTWWKGFPTLINSPPAAE